MSKPPSKTNQLWQKIESLNWVSDHDYERIQQDIKNTMLPDEAKELEDFARKMARRLYKKHMKDWIAGIPLGDDSWGDLVAEVVGRGKAFYESITVEKLTQMAKNQDFEENFMYSFQDAEVDGGHNY